MHELAPLIKDLAIMMVIAGIVTLLFQKIRQPVVLGYLVAGIIIGPYTPPGILVNDVAHIKILSDLGVIFLLFSLGLEFSFHKLARIGFSATITGLIEVILMIFLGMGVGKLLGWSTLNSLFLGAAISISSSTIIVKAFNELGLTKQQFSQLTLGISIVDDLLAILLLVFLTTLVTTNQGFSTGLLWPIGKLMLVVVGWFVVGYFFIPPIFRRIMRYASDETITIVSVGMCLLLVTIAAYFNYSVALGAFIMGSILAETPLIHRIEHIIKPIRDIFAAVFFITVGMLINPEVIEQHWLAVIFITMITILGKSIGNSLGAFLTGQNLKTSVQVGLGMAQVGEFSFLIIALGVTYHAVKSELYPIIVAVSVITIFITPYLIKHSNTIATQIDANLSNGMKSFFDHYTTSINNLLARLKQQKIFRTAMARLILNGIIVAIIFIIIKQQLLPQIEELLESQLLAEISCWFLAIFLASPFIWGMLLSIPRDSLRIKKIHRNFLPVLTWLIALAEIASLSFTYFHTWLVLLLFFMVSILLFSYFYEHTGQVYSWFERRLVSNIRKYDLESQTVDQFNNLSLRHIYLDDNNPWIGHSIHSLAASQQISGLIVGLERNGIKILDPDASIILQVGDRLFTVERPP